MTSRLSSSIRGLHASLAAPPTQYKELDNMLCFLRQSIVPKIGASGLEAFGSCSNGLWTRSSDADLTLIIPRCNNKAKILTKLKVVRDYISKQTPCALNLTIVENARIPVLKLGIEDYSSTLRELDISVNNISGIENSQLVKAWATFDPRFIPLAFAVKSWAKARDINDRAKGTLSTYTLLLQLVYILRSRKVIPPFSDFSRPEILEAPYEELNGIVRPTPFNIHHPFVSKNVKDDEGILLRNFFTFFGDENLLNGADIQDGEIIAAPTPTGALIMRCPLTQKDVNVMSGSAWRAIHSEFTKARDVLKRCDDLDLQTLTSHS
jgi:DNA polymerase sigma